MKEESEFAMGILSVLVLWNRLLLKRGGDRVFVENSPLWLD